jgi:Mrp family chromosome partitioning ATPase
VFTFCDAAAGPAAGGEIITVFAPKGGAGTTTLATNLGVVLARAGHRVRVVDLDIAAGDTPGDADKVNAARILAPPASLPSGTRGDALPCLLGRLRDRWRTA